MPPDLSFHLKPDADLSDALVLVGAPTLGLVGSITARYVVETLEMERVGGVHSTALPAVAMVEDGRPVHPIRVHALDTSCGLGLKCDRLVVFTSEFVMDHRTAWRVGEAIMDWCAKEGAEMVIVPDAIAADDDDEETISGIASTDRAGKLLEKAGIEGLGQGMVVGLTGALLGLSEQRGIDLACLLARSQPEHPDARAAARIVKILDRLLPAIKIEAGPLIKKAEEIEAKVQALREQALRQQAPPGREPHSPMFA